MERRGGLGLDEVVADTDKRRWSDLCVRFRFPFKERLGCFGRPNWVVRVIVVIGWLMR